MNASTPADQPVEDLRDAEIERLRVALWTYGRHLESCSVHRTSCGGCGCECGRCDCGLARERGQP